MHNDCRPVCSFIFNMNCWFYAILYAILRSISIRFLSVLSPSHSHSSVDTCPGMRPCIPFQVTLVKQTLLYWLTVQNSRQTFGYTEGKKRVHSTKKNVPNLYLFSMTIDIAIKCINIIHENAMVFNFILESVLLRYW